MKNEVLKNVLLYFAIFILLVLLFLPPILRKYVPKEEKVEKPKDVYATLSCSKGNERLDTSYINNKPTFLYYIINGNYQDVISEDNDSDHNPIVDDLSSMAKIVYNEVNDNTSFEINFANGNYQNVLMNYSKSIDEQNNYYTEMGFTCFKTVN